MANLRQVTELHEDHIVRFVTAFTRGDDVKRDHCLIFEWADGGSLRDLWNRLESPILIPQLVEETTTQLLGLAKAICAVHYPSTQNEGLLHGDLKPENILCFSGRGALGTWKIGDWGLAKPKNSATIFGNEITRNRATIRYEAPESVTGVRVENRSDLLKTRSRLFDVWAMGCIMFESIIWILEGINGLGEFYHALAPANVDMPYFQPGVSNELELRPVVANWSERLAKNPACHKGTALGDLLELVRTSLLVVRLPEKLAARESTQRRSTFHSTESSSEAAGSESIQDLTELRSQLPISGETLAGITLKVTEDDVTAVTELEENAENQNSYRFRADQLKERLEVIMFKGSANSSYWLTEIPTHSIPVEEPVVPWYKNTSPGGPFRFDSDSTAASRSNQTTLDTNITYPDSVRSTDSQSGGQGSRPENRLLAVQKQQDVSVDLIRHIGQLTSVVS
jgi:serine/threonine protein kinase